MDDAALLPELLDGLEDYVPQLTLERVAEASHWIVHEQPEFVIGGSQRSCVGAPSWCRPRPPASGGRARTARCLNRPPAPPAAGS